MLRLLRSLPGSARRSRLPPGRTLLLAAALALPACAVGAPPGFSSGDVWNVPLVAPLDDDVLLVPVTIKDQGPYLFMIDPDSRASSLDAALVSDLDLYSAYGPEEITEADHKVPTFIAEVPRARIGELEVRSQKWRVHKVGTFWVGGRRVRGLLGRDVIADSLILGVDRDRGLLQLATQGHLDPPADATAVSFRRFYHRHLAEVSIAGRPARMHLDLGGRLSRLWADEIRERGLPRVPVKAELIDEYGTKQTVSGGGIATEVSAGASGAATAQGVLMVPFADRRVDKEDIDGALGQSFLSRFRVTANWHKGVVWLSPRAADLHAGAAERIGRWAQLRSCRALGCVKAELVRPTAVTQRGDPGAAALLATPGADPTQAPGAAAEPAAEPPEGPVKVVLTREAPARNLRLEVLLEAVDAAGKSLGMARIQATFMPGADRVEATLDSTYRAAAGLALLDVSPLGRPCTKDAGCLWVQSAHY